MEDHVAGEVQGAGQEPGEGNVAGKDHGAGEGQEPAAEPTMEDHGAGEGEGAGQDPGERDSKHSDLEDSFDYDLW